MSENENGSWVKVDVSAPLHQNEKYRLRFHGDTAMGITWSGSLHCHICAGAPLRQWDIDAKGRSLERFVPNPEPVAETHEVTCCQCYTKFNVRVDIDNEHGLWVCGDCSKRISGEPVTEPAEDGVWVDLLDIPQLLDRKKEYRAVIRGEGVPLVNGPSGYCIYPVPGKAVHLITLNELGARLQVFVPSEPAKALESQSYVRRCNSDLQGGVSFVGGFPPALLGKDVFMAPVHPGFEWVERPLPMKITNHGDTVVHVSGLGKPVTVEPGETKAFPSAASISAIPKELR